MSFRRATGFAVLTVLLSLVGALLVGAAPAHATDVDRRIGYRCSSSFGSGSSDVRIRVTIPDRVRRGVEVPARRVRFAIKVPRAMVDTMRSYGVTHVSAVGRARYTVGSLRLPIRRLRIPETSVPDSGGMALTGSGRAAAFTPTETGTFRVQVTKSLTATATARGGLAGSGTSADLTCAVRRGESRLLAMLQVVR